MARGIDVASGLMEAGVPEPTEANAVFAHLRQMEKFVHDLAPLIHAKRWVLEIAPPGHRLWIGDDPVVLMSSPASTTPQLGVGYGSYDADLAFPLSPDVNLRLLGPATFDLLERRAPHNSMAKDVLECLRTGAPRHLKRTEVDELNRQQVANADRYIFARDANFDLAREVLDQRPEWRRGSAFRMTNQFGSQN